MQSSRSIACLLARFDTPRLKALLEERADGATLIVSLLNKLKDFTGERWEQEDDVTLVTLLRTADSAVVKNFLGGKMQVCSIWVCHRKTLPDGIMADILDCKFGEF